MTDYAFPKASGAYIHHIDTAGGLTKPTTGYTFRNVQIDSQQIVSSLKSGTDLDRKPVKARFRFYDRLLLGIIDQEPHKVKKIMDRLFQRNHFPRILRFLDEESSLLDEIRIFCSIPWVPFLKQLFRK